MALDYRFLEALFLLFSSRSILIDYQGYNWAGQMSTIYLTRNRENSISFSDVELYEGIRTSTQLRVLSIALVFLQRWMMPRRDYS